MSSEPKSSPQLLIAGLDFYGQVSVRLAAEDSSWSSLGRAGAAPFEQVAVLEESDARLTLFARDSEGRLSFVTQNSSGVSGWSDWTTLKPKATSGPVVAGENVFVVSAGKLRVRQGKKWSVLVECQEILAAAGSTVLVRTSDGKIKSFKDGKSNILALKSDAGLAMALTSGGQAEAFGISDGVVSYSGQNSTGSWTKPAIVGSKPPKLTGSIAAARNEDGRLEVYGTTDKGELWNCWETTAGKHDWSVWKRIGGTGLSSPVATVLANGAIAVLTSGSGKALSLAHQKSPGKAPWIWQKLGGAVSSFVAGFSTISERVPGAQIQQLLDTAAANVQPQFDAEAKKLQQRVELSNLEAQRKVDEANGLTQQKIATSKFEAIYYTSGGEIQAVNPKGERAVIANDVSSKPGVSFSGDVVRMGGFLRTISPRNLPISTVYIKVAGNGRTRKLKLTLSGVGDSNFNLMILSPKSLQKRDQTYRSNEEFSLNVPTKKGKTTTVEARIGQSHIPGFESWVKIESFSLDGDVVDLNHAMESVNHWRETRQTIPSDLCNGFRTVSKKVRNELIWTRATHPFALRSARELGQHPVTHYYSPDEPILSVTQDPETEKIYWIQGSGTIMEGSLTDDKRRAVLDISTNYGGEAWILRIALPGGLIDKKKIFWTSSSGVWNCNLDGSDPRLVVSGSLAPRPVALAVDNRIELGDKAVERRIYWIDRDVRSIRSARLDGSDVRSLFPTDGVQHGLALDEDLMQIYWTELASPKDLATGCIGQWNLDDPDGSTALDQSARNENGTLVGKLTRTETDTLFPGQKTTVLSFNGSAAADQHVAIPKSPFAEPKRDFTIGVWACPNTIKTGYRGLLGRQDMNETEWYKRDPSLWQAGTGLHYDSYDLDHNRFSDVIEDVFLEPNQWVHLAWVKQGDVYTFYRNGFVLAVRPAPDQLFSNEQDYWIGRVDYFWNGDIGRVRIWDRALDQEQVRNAALSPAASVLMRGNADGSGVPDRLFELSTEGGLALKTKQSAKHVKAIRAVAERRNATLLAEQNRQRAERQKADRIKTATKKRDRRVNEKTAAHQKAQKQAAADRAAAKRRLAQAKADKASNIAKARQAAKEKRDSAPAKKLELQTKAALKERSARNQRDKAKQDYEDAKK